MGITTHSFLFFVTPLCAIYMTPPPSLVFTVRRQPPQLVAPAKPTPRELKPLSDLDDQEGLRFHSAGIQIYKNAPSMEGKDPARVFRDALAQTLVFYYPLAGRLREGPGRKLSVDCTGEGVLFIEADADVALEIFGDKLQPPLSCMKDLLFDVPGSDGIVDCPLLLFQVTRFKCGGFIFAIRFNHTMCDTIGLFQFGMALGEMAHGASAPSITPVWRRDFFSARNPPRVTCTHHEFDKVVDTSNPSGDTINRSFYFTLSEVSSLRKFLPEHLRKCSTFEVLAAYLWRCRTLSLQLDPKEEVRFMCVVNARFRRFNLPVPVGYYGNAVAFPVVVTTAKKLCESPLEYALELVRKAKAKVTEEYMQSLADLMVIRGRPIFTTTQTYVVVDNMRAGFADVDYGWGQGAFGGIIKVVPERASLYVPFVNEKGDDGVMVPIFLPSDVMERFEKNLETMLLNDQIIEVGASKSKL